MACRQPDHRICEKYPDGACIEPPTVVVDRRQLFCPHNPAQIATDSLQLSDLRLYWDFMAPASPSYQPAYVTYVPE